MSETTAGATTPGTAALVDSIYAAVPCMPQNGGQPCTPEAVSDAGPGGPALLYWQATGYTLSAPILAGMQPLFDNQGDDTLAGSCFFNQSAVRLPLLRRRALLPPQPPGESLVTVTASEYCATDKTDSITMAMVNLGGMSAPPQVRLAAAGMAEGTNDVYTAQQFSSEGGTLVISADATAWSGVPDHYIAAQLYLDGEPLRELGLFANPASTHLPLVGVDLVVTGISAGQHQLDLVGNPGASVDDNDVWALTVLEMQGSANATPVASGVPASQQGGGTLVTAPYTAGGGEQLILVTLSGWTAKANTMISAQVMVDDNPVGTLQTWASLASTHLVIAGGDVAAGQITSGQHEISVVAGPGTITDQNDQIAITVLEFFP